MTDSTPEAKLAALKALLLNLEPGDVTEPFVGDIEAALATCWESLSRSRDGGMKGQKLHGRTERMTWNPPLLEFQIERHGGTVQGSIYAEVQLWSINVEEGSARSGIAGKRRLRPAEKRLDVRPIALQLAAAMTRGGTATGLKALSPSRYRVRIADLIPQTNAQTTSSRRKRLLAELTKALGQEWRLVPGTRYVFERA